MCIIDNDKKKLNWIRALSESELYLILIIIIIFDSSKRI